MSLSMTEKEFLDVVDGNFPYDDETRWKFFIDLAVKISPNAAFAVLHEIVRPPRSACVLPQQRETMLEYWRARCDHPVADIVADAAAKMIAGEGLSVADAIGKMRRLLPYLNQYAALSILYFSCKYGDEADPLVTTYDEIRQSWRASRI